MSTEKDYLVTFKSMAYDLITIFKADPDKTYTPDDIEKIINAYIQGMQQ